MSMFASSQQPPLVSLFSSTGTNPLQLFSYSTDPDLPTDSFIHLLHDASCTPTPPPPAAIISSPRIHLPSSSDDVDENKNDDAPPPTSGYALDQTVLHIQSPTICTTYIRCPPLRPTSSDAEWGSTNNDLALTLPFMHVQVRNLVREWALEVGVVDRSGRRGIIRCSTFQKEPQLIISESQHSSPVLHLPLTFPSRSAGLLTAWSTLTLNLPKLLSHFSSLPLHKSSSRAVNAGLLDDDENEAIQKSPVPLPGGTFSHTSYVKVYATCRLRRIWFSEATGVDQKLPWEFQLYAAGPE